MPFFVLKNTTIINANSQPLIRVFLLVYCVRSPFTLNVIPGLTKLAPCLTRGNPMISTGFLTHYTSFKGEGQFWYTSGSYVETIMLKVVEF